MNQCLNGQTVAIETEATDDTEAGTRNHGLVAELLTLVDVGDVNLDDGTLQRADAVLQGNTGMSIGPGIQHDTVAVTEACRRHLIDERPLDSTLIVVYLDVGVTRLQSRQKIKERLLPVDARLTSTQHIQVGTIDNQYFHLLKNS